MSELTSATVLTIRVVYLARLREAFGAASESVTLSSDSNDVAGLLALLRGRGGAWAAELARDRSVRVAVNHAVVAADAPIRDGDEVALFPPVTGG